MGFGDEECADFIILWNHHTAVVVDDQPLPQVEVIPLVPGLLDKELVLLILPDKHLEALPKSSQESVHNRDCF